MAAVLREIEGRVKSMAIIHENLYQSPTFKILISNYIFKNSYVTYYTSMAYQKEQSRRI